MNFRLFTDTWETVKSAVVLLIPEMMTFAFGAGNFSIDLFLQLWFDRITGNCRLTS